MSKSIQLGVRGLYAEIASGGHERGLIGKLKLPASGPGDDLVIFQVNYGPDGTEEQILRSMTELLRSAALELGRHGGGLTVYESLRIARDEGRSFTRRGSAFMQWDLSWTYKFTGEEMLAIDWEDVETFIPKLTKGRWGPAQYPPPRDDEDEE